MKVIAGIENYVQGLTSWESMQYLVLDTVLINIIIPIVFDLLTNKIYNSTFLEICFILEIMYYNLQYSLCSLIIQLCYFAALFYSCYNVQKNRIKFHLLRLRNINRHLR